MTMQSLCFTCMTLPAGNDDAGPYSAYCPECQPRDSGPRPRGGHCCCAACGRVFATLTDFDRHQERIEGVFSGRCSGPVTLGLELAGGVWGTPEGNANRAQRAGRLPRVRSLSLQI